MPRATIVVLDADPATGCVSAPKESRGELALDGLARWGEVHAYSHTQPEWVTERAQNAEIVLTNKVVLGETELATLPKLQLICVLATGTNVIDLAAAKRRGIVVSNVPAYSTHSTAQHTIALLLELCHQVGRHSESVRRGDWSSSTAFSYWQEPLVELYGRTLGIVGWGAIGQQVGRVATALGMRVIVHTRTPRPDQTTYVTFEELLEQSDVVSLHVPLTAETTGLLDAAALAKMKSGALLLNVARGPLLDEQAVREALDRGRLGGLAVDVLSVEPPPPNHPLLDAPRTILTPHIAWATLAARERLLAITCENIAAFLRGEPQNRVI